VEHGGVHESVHPVGEELPDPLRDVVPARHHVVGAEAVDEFQVVLRGVRDHGEALVLGELHHVVAQGPGGPGDGQGLLGLQVQHLEDLQGREPVHGQRGGRGEVRARREAGDRVVGSDQELRVGAPVLPARQGDGHDRLPHAPGAALPDLVDDPGRVHPRHVRRPQVLQRLTARAQHGVRGADGGRPDPDPHLPGSGVGIRHLVHGEDLGPSERLDSDDSHARSNPGPDERIPGSLRCRSDAVPMRC
jgi:hypothetical protein